MKALIETTRADAFDLKMIIVENKVDLEEERKVKEEAIEEYQQASNIDVIKASSKTGEGIEQAFLSLIKELQKDKKLGAVQDEDNDDAQSKISYSLSFKITNKKNKKKKKQKCAC